MNKRKLTDNTILKYKRIIDVWFLNSFNGAAAYRKFYKNVKKDATATVNFSKIQALPEIKSYIKEKYKQASEKARLSHEDILDELEAFATMDMTKVVNLKTVEKTGIRMVLKKETDGELEEEEYKYFEQELQLSDFDQLTDVQRRSIESVKQGKHGIEIKFFPKEKAFEMLNKHKGFYEADNNQKKAEINIITSSENHNIIVQDILDGKK